MHRALVFFLTAAVLLAGCSSRSRGPGDPTEGACPRIAVDAVPNEIRAGERAEVRLSVAACDATAIALPADGCGILFVLPPGGGTPWLLREAGAAHASPPPSGCGAVPASILPGTTWNATRAWDGLVVDGPEPRPAPAGNYTIEARVGDARASATVEIVGAPLQRVVLANDSVRTLSRGAVTSLEGAEHIVVTDGSTWRELWTGHTRDEFPAPPVPDVDFARERVVLALLGARPSECWAVEVARARTSESAGVTTLELVVHEPADGAECAPIETRPYHFVAIAKLPTRLAFETTNVAEGEP